MCGMEEKSRRDIFFFFFSSETVRDARTRL